MDKSPTYFEAIIQLRNPSDECISFIHNQVKKRNDTFISKIDELDNGIDIYISSQRFARAIGNKMKKAFKGELKTSRTLHTVISTLILRVFLRLNAYRAQANGR